MHHAFIIGLQITLQCLLCCLEHRTTLAWVPHIYGQRPGSLLMPGNQRRAISTTPTQACPQTQCYGTLALYYHIHEVKYSQSTGPQKRIDSMLHHELSALSSMEPSKLLDGILIRVQSRSRLTTKSNKLCYTHSGTCQKATLSHTSTLMPMTVVTKSSRCNDHLIACICAV